MRKLVGIAVVAGLLVALTGCATQHSTFASCDPTGNATLVKTAGSFDVDPKADFPTPLIAKKPELAVERTGDGAKVAPDAGINATVSLYDGGTGEAISSQSGPITNLAIRTLVRGSFPFTEALSCATVGSRIVTTGTAKQLFGPDALGLDATSTLVVVTDIDSTFLGRANGVDQLAVAGLPSIVLAPNGEPGFTFPPGDAPATLKIATLKAGNGATVKKGDGIIVQYTGVLWATKKVFDSTWDKGTPASLTAVSIADDQTGVVPGFAKAVIGAKVGSQVLVVIPPKDGYPSGSAPSTIPDGSTLVFVIDILGIDKK
ncbi:MAG: FKBP-type peptidyl-prolyl cis-trans isomerase [Pseudolysinimonas sp.]